MNPLLMNELQKLKFQMSFSRTIHESIASWELAHELYHDLWAAGYNPKEGEMPREALSFFKRLRPYIKYVEEQYREEEARQKAGGREICPECKQRSVVTSFPVTYGYAGHPGAERSAYRQCENCPYEDM